MEINFWDLIKSHKVKNTPLKKIIEQKNWSFFKDKVENDEAIPKKIGQQTIVC